MTTRLGRSPAGIQDVLFNDRFTSGTLSPFSVFGGSWALGPRGLTAASLDPTGLDRDFVYMPYSLTDSWTTTSVTLDRLPRHQTWRVGLVAHSVGAAGPDKWALILRPGQLALLNENTAWVSEVPFRSRAGTTYRLAMVVNGTTVDGKVWPAGTRPPARWMISGRFAPNRIAHATDVGLYAANAVATFHQFQVLAPPPAVSATPAAPAGIFDGTRPPAVRIRVTDLAVKPHTVQIRFHLATLRGRPVASGTVPFPLRGAQPVQDVLAFPGLPNGVYRFHASLVGGGNVLTRLVGQNLAVVPVPTARRAGGTVFGLNGNLGTLSARSGAASFAAEHFALMRTQGIEAYRLQIAMPPPGRPLPLAGYARIAEAAHNAQLAVLGLLTGPSPSSRLPFARFLRRYRAFVRETVLRLANDGVRTWEIWNEPSTRRYWALGPAKYGRLLSLSVQLIHRLEPGSTVLGYAWKLPAVLRADRFRPDAWAFHYYPGPQPPVNAAYPLTGAIGHLRALLLRHHRRPQIWITETGWNTDQVRLRAQAAYLAEAGILARAERAAAVFFFTQTYDGSGYGEETPDLSPKPAYVALAAMTRMLSGTRSLGLRSPLGPEVEAAEFTGPDSRTVYALWSESGRPPVLTLPVAAGLSVYDGMANPVPPHHGRLEFPLGPLPHYLVAQGMPPAFVDRLLSGARVSGLPPYQIQLSPKITGEHGVVRITVENLSAHPEAGVVTVRPAPGLTTSNPRTALPRLTPGQTTTVTVAVGWPASLDGRVLSLAVTAASRQGAVATRTIAIHVPMAPPVPPSTSRPSPVPD